MIFGMITRRRSPVRLSSEPCRLSRWLPWYGLTGSARNWEHGHVVWINYTVPLDAWKDLEPRGPFLCSSSGTWSRSLRAMLIAATSGDKEDKVHNQTVATNSSPRKMRLLFFAGKFQEAGYAQKSFILC